MIARIKGLKISQASERTAVTGEVQGGSNQYDLLTINAPVSDGQNRAVPIYIAQSEFTEVSDWNYREITNSPISDQIMVKQRGIIIS